MSKNEKLARACAALVAVIAVMVGIFLATRPATAQGSKSFTVTVVHSDATTNRFTYQTDKEYLGEVLLEEGLIQGEAGQFGLYITTVDGEEASYEADQAYWALYEGADYAQQGVDQTPVLDGSAFSLVYTVG